MQVNREWYARQLDALAPAIAAGYGIEPYFTGTCLVGRVRPKRPDLEVWIASPACNAELGGGEHWTVALVDPEEGGLPVATREFDDAARIQVHMTAMLDLADSPWPATEQWGAVQAVAAWESRG